mmetsp:Transcript_15616/g.39545  ORF Transcript_15616/g.39545 Transcript_15616/m.39545 type:complete len:221 (+) Transcript_15616:146-808(+)
MADGLPEKHSSFQSGITKPPRHCRHWRACRRFHCRCHCRRRQRRFRPNLSCPNPRPPRHRRRRRPPPPPRRRAYCHPLAQSRRTVTAHPTSRREQYPKVWECNLQTQRHPQACVQQLCGGSRSRDRHEVDRANEARANQIRTHHHASHCCHSRHGTPTSDPRTPSTRNDGEARVAVNCWTKEASSTSADQSRGPAPRDTSQPAPSNVDEGARRSCPNGSP